MENNTILIYILIICLLTFVISILFYFIVELSKEFTRTKKNQIVIKEKEDFETKEEPSENDDMSFEHVIEITKNTTVDLRGKVKFYVEKNETNKDVFLVKDNITSYITPGKIYSTVDAELDIIYYSKPFKVFINKIK